MSSAPCPLLMCVDEGYLMPLATTLRSIADASDAGVSHRAFVFCSGVSAKQREMVQESIPPGQISLEWIDVDLSAFQDFSTLPHLSKMAYARLLVAKLLPNEVSRVLYLDVDILVLADLRGLMGVDLEGNVIGAVVDRCDAKIKSGDPDMFNLPVVKNYLNSGVLLIDVARWREHDVAGKAIRFLEENSGTPFGDQDAINVAVDGSWKILDPKWNFQRHQVVRLAHMPPEQMPGIVHFVMAEKPWDWRSLSGNAAFYDAFRRRTLFRRTWGRRVADMLLSVAVRLRRRLDRG